MAFTEWNMQGVEFANCSCNWGCPCQFNGLPSHGDCRAHTFVQIHKGRFGGVALGGLRWVFKPNRLDIDLDGRNARLSVPGVIESTAAPITNPVTGAPHHVRVQLPNGIEFSEAEFASGTARTQAAIPLEFDGTHAHLARIHWSTHGVVR